MQEYFIVTFDEYDDLEEKAAEAVVPLDYEPPSHYTIRLMDRTLDNLYLLLVAMHHSEDKEDCRFINQYLKQTMIFVEDEKEKSKVISKLKKQHQNKAETEHGDADLIFQVGKDSMLKIQEVLKNMSFTPIDYYPNKGEIQALMNRYYKKDKEYVIAYLYWLYLTDIELSEQEQETREYIWVLLNQLIKEEKK